MVMTITTSSSLLLLLLFPILDLLQAQIAYIQTSLTQAQMEKSAQAYLASSNPNEVVEDLEDNDMSPTRLIDRWPKGYVHPNPRRRGGDRPQQPRRNVYYHNSEGTARPKKDDDLILAALNISYENDNSGLLARTYSMPVTQRFHDYGLGPPFESKYLGVGWPCHLTRKECRSISQTQQLQSTHDNQVANLRPHNVEVTAHVLETIMKVVTRMLGPTLAIYQQGKPQLASEQHEDVAVNRHEDGLTRGWSFGTIFWRCTRRDYENCTRDVVSAIAHSVGQLHQPQLLHHNLSNHTSPLHEDGDHDLTRATTASTCVLYHQNNESLVHRPLRGTLENRLAFQIYARDVCTAYEALARRYGTRGPANTANGRFKTLPAVAADRANERTQLVRTTIINEQQAVESLVVLGGRQYPDRPDTFQASSNNSMGASKRPSLHAPPGRLALTRGGALHTIAGAQTRGTPRKLVKGRCLHKALALVHESSATFGRCCKACIKLLADHVRQIICNDVLPIRHLFSGTQVCSTEEELAGCPSRLSPLPLEPPLQNQGVVDYIQGLGVSVVEAGDYTAHRCNTLAKSARNIPLQRQILANVGSIGKTGLTKPLKGFYPQNTKGYVNRELVRAYRIFRPLILLCLCIGGMFGDCEATCTIIFIACVGGCSWFALNGLLKKWF